MELVQLDSDQIVEVIDVITEANIINLKKGRDRVTLNVEGEPGLGKTSLIKQYAKAKKYNFVQINLAQLEEISD